MCHDLASALVADGSNKICCSLTSERVEADVSAIAQIAASRPEVMLDTRN